VKQLQYLIPLFFLCHFQSGSLFAQSDSLFQHILFAQKDTTVNDSINKITQNVDTITIVAVGDMMFGTNYPDKSYLPPDSGKGLLSYVIPVIQNASLRFGNLEGCILNGEGTVKKCRDPKKCYAFRQPGYMVERLVEAGFDVVSVANNHVSDFGQQGKDSTVSILARNSIHYAGLETCPYDTFTIKGVTYGFTAFSVNSGTNKIQDYKLLDNIVQHLDTIADIVIVSFHGGAEGQNYRHVIRKTETFIGEDRGNVYQFAHRAIDDGADLVIGHGPHVPRAIDIYKEHLIMYSLGNFCTYHRFSLEGQAGVAPLMEIKTLRNGRFISGKIYSYKQIGEGGPIPDTLNRALKSIKELTINDFPEVPVRFDENGVFYLTK
jgi:poly-gamma-glutamate capsule biosynthesis protein CapA/YwtB (metallophosphatase superfamily)